MLRVETSSDDDHPEPDLPGIEELWLYWSSPPAGLTGRALRRALFASFSSALQIRWLHGGYFFRFAEDSRPARGTIAGDDVRVQEMLRAIYPHLPDGSLGLRWTAPSEALDEFLDCWLLFRRYRSYVRQDDVPEWMLPVLREPWAACVRELVGDAVGAHAAVLAREDLADDWGDHGVALFVAAGTRLTIVQVSLSTD
ncbi:hypothetical protein OV090_02135 [Nannocystis sp. RBIL2]|uniref:hypothetical protein n=1 Tax=Nannocystis sp. RBIL2 TaxID=2996788 RepID=UPI0022706ADB|nr:hypothetical protein [Nannocystis sp. RBIL2]MCY1063539.1 hypothetical protein [Nannocystis sp. RBIL2]